MARPRWVFVAAFLVVLCVGAGLRLHRLPQLPVGLHYDEAANGILAGEIARGLKTPVFIAAYTGKEVLFFYWTALWMRLFEVTPLALRLGAASIGTLTIVATLWVIYELLQDETDAHWIALLGAGFLAVSFWHLILSRYGFRAVTQPLLQALTVAALWRGLRTERTTWLFVAGFLCGMTAYTYLAARAFPIPLGAALLVLLIAERDRRRERLVQLTLFFAAAALVLAPLAHYWLTNPGSFTIRARQVAADSWSQVWGGLLACLQMFFLRGDPYIRFNLPQRPLFLPGTAALFLLGLGAGVYRFVHAARSPGTPPRGDHVPPLSLASYTLLLITIPVMLLPSALATEEITPSNLRTVGLLPFVYVFPALGLFAVKSGLRRATDWVTTEGGEWTRSQASNAVIVLLLLALGAPTTAIAYFRDWAPAGALYDAADGAMVDIAAYLDRVDSTTAALYVASQHYRHPTLAFLAEDYDEVRWLVGGRTLIFPAEDDALLVFSRSAAGHLDWLQSMLPRDALVAAPQGPDGPPTFHAYRVSGPAYPAPAQSQTADFGHAVRLLGYTVTTPPRSGDFVTVAVWWRVVNGTDWPDYRPVLRLADQQGFVWGESLPFHYPSEQWTLGEVVVDHLSIPIAPGAPPGDYAVRFGFYSPAGDVRLPLLDENGAYAGTHVELPVHVGRAARAPRPEDLAIREFLNIDMDGLTLLGSTLETTEVRPGERVHVTLFWRADKPGLSARPVSLQLGDTMLYTGDPVNGTYPFSRWVAGEVVGDRYAPRVPLVIDPGHHPLQMQVGDTVVDLGEVTVREMDRTFQVPSISHPLTVTLSDRVELLGYDLSTESVSPGGTLTLTLYWRALAEMHRDYTVFAHLLAPDGSMTGQEDRQPVGGSYPTSLWLPGEVVTDVYEIAVRPDAVHGDHQLQVGMYVPEDGTRLSVEGRPDNAVSLQLVEVTE